MIKKILLSFPLCIVLDLRIQILTSSSLKLVYHNGVIHLLLTAAGK